MRVSNLTLGDLDQWVAKAEGGSWEHHSCRNPNWSQIFVPPYSSEWTYGGPIIAREGINLTAGGYFSDPADIHSFVVTHWAATHPSYRMRGVGATPLEAAMRCYVQAKFGDEVQDVAPSSIE